MKNEFAHHKSAYSSVEECSKTRHLERSAESRACAGGPVSLPSDRRELLPRGRSGAPAPHARAGPWLLPRRSPTPLPPPCPPALEEETNALCNPAKRWLPGLRARWALRLWRGGAERSGGRHLPRAGVRWQRQDCQCQAAGVLVTSLLRLRTGEQTSGKSLATAKGEVWHYTKVSTNWAIPTLSGTRPKWSPTPFVYTRPSSCWDWNIAGARIGDLLQYNIFLLRACAVLF